MDLPAFNSAVLKKCFKDVIHGKGLSMDLEVIEQIIRNDFNINSVSPELAAALPHFFVYKMESWPGWDKYHQYKNNDLTLRDWFEEFIKFLSSKLDEAINVHYKEIQSERKTGHDQSVQTENRRNAYAPYSINIRGNPSLLNTLVFVSGNDKTIKLEVHEPMDGEEFKEMSLTALLNWPHAGIHMFSPIFSITRKNVHVCDRHICCGNTRLVSPDQPVHIQTVELDELSISVDTVYEIYSKVKRAMSRLKFSDSRLQMFESLLQEVLADLEEIQILKEGKPSIGSFVRFNIGKGVYVRSKTETTGAFVCYNEVIVPMIELSVNKVGTPDEIKSFLGSLSGTNIFPGKSLNCHLSCNFCKVSFSHPHLLINHFRNIHKMVPPMKCSACENTFSAMDLAQNRWDHQCTNATNSA